jgi:predicted DNA-binding transcriptional regulator YafY
VIFYRQLCGNPYPLANQTTLLRLLKLIALLKQKPPKSVKFIAEFIQASERSAYRYIELLKEVGFNLIVNKRNQYSIEDNQWLSPSHFNQEELSYLKSILTTVGREHLLSQSLLDKLSLVTDLDFSTQTLYRAKLAKFVELINQAIADNKQIMLKAYQSINTQHISDRLVEPIKFTEHYRTICAFEVDSETNKYFNLERIGEVQLLDHDQEYEDQHEYTKPDVFGFSKGEQTYTVHLKLNLKAKLLLTEEYPLSRAYITPLKQYQFEFKAEVNSVKPVKRFYQGLKEDIEVLEENNFILE